MTFVRDSEPVVFSPRPFAPQPVTRVRWRGMGPRCPALTLVCDSISASKSKCAVCQVTISGVTHYYLKCKWACTVAGQHLEEELLLDAAAGCNYCNPDTHTSDGTHIFRHYTSGGVLDCTRTVVYCGGSLVSLTSDPSGCNTCSPTGSSVESSSEYTTEILEATAVAALPDYSGFDGDHSISGQNTTCSATRALSTDETSYSIRRFKHKWTFPTPAPFNYTLKWKEHFVPSGGGSATDTDRSASITSGDTETAVFEVLEPATNGTTNITNVTCTIP